jgi:hypothetical protein
LAAAGLAGAFATGLDFSGGGGAVLVAAWATEGNSEAPSAAISLRLEIISSSPLQLARVKGRCQYLELCRKASAS